jgi:hypothetical protein
MKRRLFIKLLLQSILSLSGYALLPRSGAAALRKPKSGTLASFLDTLIPEDNISPSASMLGLEHKLVKHAKRIDNYTLLLERGCEWLNLQSQALYRTDFDNLSSSQRESVVGIAENSQQNSIPKLFFERVKYDLFGFYYTESAAVKGFNLRFPPQPSGYPDYMNSLQGKA